jgi:hypothetical protein
VARGQHGFGDAPHVPFVLHAITNQVCHRQQFHGMQAAEFHQLRNARHRSVVVHDFANHPGVIKAREARQVHGSFGLSGAHQHAAIARAQGVDVSGPREIFGMGVRAGRGQNRSGSVGGAGAGGGAAARVNRLAERRAEHGSVARRDGRERQRVTALLRHRQAN